MPVGEAIVNGIISGCNNRRGALASTIRSAVRAGINVIKSDLKIHSPSKATEEEIGEPIMEGIEVGFTNRLPEALKTIRSGMDNLMTGAAKVVDHGTYTAPAFPAVSRSVTAIDYDRLADAVAQRRRTSTSVRVSWRRPRMRRPPARRRAVSVPWPSATDLRGDRHGAIFHFPRHRQPRHRRGRR